MTVWTAPKPAVLVALSILSAAFDGYAVVSTKLPKTKPLRFVRISRTGGNQANPATAPAHILVECFGVDTATVETMCSMASAALRNACGTTVEGAYVRGWSNEFGPTDIQHPDILDRERWQFHGDLSVKAN